VLVLGCCFTPVASARPTGDLVLSIKGSLWAFDLAHPRLGHPLFHSRRLSDRNPASAATSGMLAFDRTRPGGTAFVYVAGTDGTLRRLVQGRQPGFSPDDRQLVISRPDGLAIVDASDGSLVRQLTHDSNDANPNWGRQGLIAFDRNDRTTHAIITVRSDGTDLQQMATPQIGIAHPSWSSDGNALMVANSERRCTSATPVRMPAVNAVDHLFVYDVSGSRCNGRYGDWSPHDRYVAIPVEDRMAIVNLARHSNPESICAANFAGGAVWASREIGQSLLLGIPRNFKCGRPGPRPRKTRVRVCYLGVCWYVYT
jgi:hypothetical protein